jgi:hypothetical protein
VIIHCRCAAEPPQKFDRLASIRGPQTKILNWVFCKTYQQVFDNTVETLGIGKHRGVGGCVGELAVLPMRADLAMRIQNYLEDRPRGAIWPGAWYRSAATMMRIDLEPAGIAYSIDGRDFDFHALRHQFITNLARAGVPLATAKELARHSKVDLTANIYTHLNTNDTAPSVEKLPSLPTGQRASVVLGKHMGKHMGKQVTRKPAISSNFNGLQIAMQPMR